MRIISAINIKYLRKYLPANQWLRKYSLRIFGYDIFSGITLAAYAIPVSLAYATLAGLPPQYGVYGYLLGGLFYAMLGTSRQLAIGPTSAISLLIGTTLAGLAQGDTQRWVDLSSLTALVFAVLSILFYVLRMSSIINFISETILLGFKAGAALAIGMTQLPKLFGLEAHGDSFFTRLINFINQLSETNPYVLLFGILAVTFISLGEKYLPNKPVTIIIVMVAIAISSFAMLGDFGFKTVGFIPSGLPEFYFPLFHIADIQRVMPLSFACFLLAYIESISTAKALAQKNDYEIDARQELLALGVANFAAALGHGYPVSGGLSQSAVNDEAGAKTPISLIVASATIALCLLFLTGLLKNLPQVILASIVLVAIAGLIDFKELKRLYRGNRSDFIIAMTALVGVIVFGILQGVIIASVASLLLIIKAVSSPHVAFLGRIPNTNRYSDFKRHPDNEILAGIMLVRVESPLLYFNVSNVYNVIWKKVLASDSTLKVVILDLSTSAYIDSSGARFIKKLYYNLEEIGISLRLAEAHSGVRDMLRFEYIETLMGHISRKDGLHDVVTACLCEHEGNLVKIA